MRATRRCSANYKGAELTCLLPPPSPPRGGGGGGKRAMIVDLWHMGSGVLMYIFVGGLPSDGVMRGVWGYCAQSTTWRCASTPSRVGHLSCNGVATCRGQICEINSRISTHTYLKYMCIDVRKHTRLGCASSCWWLAPYPPLHPGARIQIRVQQPRPISTVKRCWSEPKCDGTYSSTNTTMLKKA